MRPTSQDPCGCKKNRALYFNPCSLHRVEWIENEYLSPVNTKAQLVAVIAACSTEQRGEVMIRIRDHRLKGRGYERDYRLLTHEAP